MVLAFDAEGIPYAMHWGKAGEFTTERVRRMYGSAVDDWLAARHALLEDPYREVFLNPFLERIGLDAEPTLRLPV
jgi:hypothetical protein